MSTLHTDWARGRWRAAESLTMGPHWFRSMVYDCRTGFCDGSSGFWAPHAQ